jgi:hypothetical protein
MKIDLSWEENKYSLIGVVLFFTIVVGVNWITSLDYFRGSDVTVETGQVQTEEGMFTDEDFEPDSSSNKVEFIDEDFDF